MEIEDRSHIEQLSRFGPEYSIGSLKVSRNNPVTYGKKGRYYIRPGGASVTLSDEQMQELFMAYMAMRREYETGEEIKYDEGTGT